MMKIFFIENSFFFRKEVDFLFTLFKDNFVFQQHIDQRHDIDRNQVYLALIFGI